MNMTNTPTYIFHELLRRDVPVEILDEEHSLMRYYYKGEWHMLRNCITEKASSISSQICNTKTMAELVAKEVGLKVPASTRYDSDEQAAEFMEKYAPIVVKPLDAAHGHGVSVNITSKTGLKKALSAVKKYSKKRAILQEMVTGQDVRLLIIDGKFVAAVRRMPATVIGDGVRTVKELIDAENKQSHRSSGKRGKLSIINLDSAKAYLRRKIWRVPAEGERVPVVGIGNTSLGGHAEDATDDISPKIYKKAEEFAQRLKLPVCGVDIMLNPDGSYHFIEGNACPGFGPHHHPRVGKTRNVTKVFVDMLLSVTEEKSIDKK